MKKSLFNEAVVLSSKIEKAKENLLVIDEIYYQDGENRFIFKNSVNEISKHGIPANTVAEIAVHEIDYFQMFVHHLLVSQLMKSFQALNNHIPYHILMYHLPNPKPNLQYLHKLRYLPELLII